MDSVSRNWQPQPLVYLNTGITPQTLGLQTLDKYEYLKHLDGLLKAETIPKEIKDLKEMLIFYSINNTFI